MLKFASRQRNVRSQTDSNFAQNDSDFAQNSHEIFVCFASLLLLLFSIHHPVKDHAFTKGIKHKEDTIIRTGYSMPTKEIKT